MSNQRSGNASRRAGGRALSLRSQWILLAASLLIGTAAVGWWALDALASASIWRSASVAGGALAVLVLGLALAWRLVARSLGVLDDLVAALERVAKGDLDHRLDELGSAEMRRVARAFNLAVQNSARRAQDLKQSSMRRLQAAIDLRESRELAMAIQETALDSIITIDSRGEILAFNAAAEATFGFKASQAIGQKLAGLIVPERLREPYRRGFAHYLETGQGPILGKRIEMPALRASGEEFPVEVAIVANALHGSTCFTATIRDLSDRKQAEEKLARAAMYDRLTGLPNRTLLLDRVQLALARARRSGELFALMFLDFDRFKLINDGLGHDVGDALLCEIAVRLTRELRCGDSLSRSESGTSAARMGGDEFVVMIEPIAQAEDALAVADRLLAALSRPYRLGPHEVFSTASIGIVVARGDHDRAEDLIRDADTAMYEAKRAGKARYAVFDEEMRNRVQRRHLLENELRRAIEGEQFSLAFQPIVSLETGRLKSVEALLRWQHPGQGFISPAEFIPIAEESDLILHIGRWVLNEAARQMAEWVQRLGPAAPPTISINISRKQFAQSDLAEQVRAAADAAGLPASRVQLEITEDTFASDVPTAIATMNAIKRLGFLLAIDDFGTGCSSFASLHKFPADVLKIDRSLLVDIETSKQTAALVHSLAILTNNLGLAIVAEGVERESQLRILRELGCDFGQGFYFSRPLSPDAFAEFALRRIAEASSVIPAASLERCWTDPASPAVNA
ncbi:MAG TPA: EAL domain-containing protein [Pirellulaceae bacterium]|nr:EAL domain-containing protein [Pirellulaceae bacterium]